MLWYNKAIATIDKTSGREEVERFKGDLSILSSEGKLQPEALVLLNSLMIVVELILSIFLEKEHTQNQQKLKQFTLTNIQG
ncbi:hypothetical protein DSLASN_21120 [Desulfoluna limicola]|uniref:Uncharacterized protein n=1 Tax=Desulfoluna limicola TaxID=2810562 RepID=A0ABM7PH98_9BACT|nr:hypothetical protein [Desulfoluna limicola]BCS96480.1 hypothetical protein DSLASN_21120 [Desulfoluna limicola]